MFRRVLLTATVLALCGAVVLLLAGPGRVLARLGLAGEAPVARSPLLLVTGLPIIWGEGDIDAMLGGDRRPSQSWRWLDRNYELAAVDRVDATALKGKEWLLLAQPRALAPEEFVAIDEWVRGGGRALILTDPSLRWPSQYHFTDPRAPPAMSLLDPLLDHWGLRLDLVDLDGRAHPAAVSFDTGAGRGTLMVIAPGRFVATGQSCRIENDGLSAWCGIGRGNALLIADADLMADPLWGCPDEEARWFVRCRPSNAEVMAMLLDRLSGISRDGNGKAPAPH